MTTSLETRLDPGLGAIVGERWLINGPRGADFAIDGRVPRWVVFPATVEEVSRCLALAHAEGWAVAPTGGGTRRHWGAPPRALDLVISLDRLSRILAHEPADLTMSVEAGTTLGALATHLRPHAQILPLDPAHAGRTTVGGAIATRASGPARTRYGTMRDLLLGVTVVQADGTVVKGGGRVVKNVTGYDMPKLHVGALGTLGIVVEAHLRLHPLPKAERTWVFALPSREAVLDAALALLDLPLSIGRLELLDAGALAASGQRGDAGAALAVQLGSVAEAVAAQGVRVEEVCRGRGGSGREIEDGVAFWRAVSNASWPGDPSRSLALRVGVRSTDVVTALRAVEGALGGARVARTTAELADGVVHVVTDEVRELAVAGTLERVRAALEPLQASCVVESVALGIKGAVDPWGAIGPAWPLMQRLKAELDPRGVLNPGRFVGGL